MIDTIINIIRSKTILFYLILGIIISAFIFSLDQSKLNHMILNTPIGLSIKAIIYFPSSGNINVVSNSFLYNIISFLIGILFYFFIKWVDFLLIAKNIERRTFLIKISKKFSSIGIFNEEILTFLIKDIKYIIRSSRTCSQIIFEILLVIIFTFAYYYNLNIFPHNVYFTLFAAIVLPVLLWDFYLSNQWGLEKKSFGFYLYSPVKFYTIILTKNLSYFIIKIPVLVISTFLFSYFISIKLLPFVIFLQIIINLLLIAVANYNSIQYPFPIDISENLLSQNSPNTRFSIIGFLGLISILLFSVILLFIIWKSNESAITFLIFLFITLFSAFTYLIMLRSISKYFVKQKEKMYFSLRSNE